MIFWKQVLPQRITDVFQARPTLQALRPHMSALVQPPLIAQALKRLYEVSKDKLVLYELLAKVVRYHDWLASHRNFDADGLMTIISPFESGIDWKPSFDEVVGYRARTTPKSLLTSALYWRVMAKVDAANFLRQYDLQKIRDHGAFLVKEVGYNTIYACELLAWQSCARSLISRLEQFSIGKRDNASKRRYSSICTMRRRQPSTT
jgi:hypothetical protein